MNKKVKTFLPIVSALAVVLAGYFIVDSILTVKPGEVKPRNKKIERIVKDSKKEDKKEVKKKKEKKEEPKIPDLVGLDLKTAKWLIKKNKCELGNVTYETSDAVYDTVMKQTPNAGKKTKDKVVINIVLSNGAAFGINETRVTRPVIKVEEKKDEDEDKDENSENKNKDENEQNSQGQTSSQGTNQWQQTPGQNTGQGQQSNPGQQNTQPNSNQQ